MNFEVIIPIAIFLTVLDLTPSSGFGFYSFTEKPLDFCDAVPQLSSIQRSNKCPTAKLFTKPLLKMRQCCDKGSETSIVRCLHDLRSRELEVVDLFLKWKEPALKDKEYMANLEQCRTTYKKIQVQSRGCANKFDAKCVDPIGFFEANCTNTKSDRCTEGFTRAIRRGALASFCTKNTSYSYYDTSETVHHRCFSGRALNRRYKSIVDDVTTMEDYCLNERYGAATDYGVYEQVKMYLDSPFSFYADQTLASNAGIYEEMESEAESFLPDLCNFAAFNNNPMECLQTAVTQSFLTFKSTEQVSKEVKVCCTKNNPTSVEDTANMQGLKKCLIEKNLFQQFYQMSGLFVRGLKRAQTGYISECMKSDMTIDSGFKDVKAAVVTNDYAHELYPNNFEEKFREKTYIDSLNYHFFLRDFAQTMSMSDEYYKAACEACADGEKWGKQAYVYPGLMCPALAAKKYYEPIVGSKTCPDLLFYKFQVAHYCCLDSAFDKFNFGSNYDPKSCPDMSDAKEVLSQ